MKKIFAILLTAAMVFSMAACEKDDEKDNEDALSHQEQEMQTADEDITTDTTELPENIVLRDPIEITEPSSNILVAYFSRVGNTYWDEGVDAVSSASLNVQDGEYAGNAQLLAQMARDVTDGDLFLIKTGDPYPSDSRETTDKATEEQEANARPALISHVSDMDAYDTVVLVYPIWLGHLPQSVFTFLEEYDFSGKRILPICTHGGSYLALSISDIMELCPNSTVLAGLAVSADDAANAQSEVEEWIGNSGII